MKIILDKHFILKYAFHYGMNVSKRNGIKRRMAGTKPNQTSFKKGNKVKLGKAMPIEIKSIREATRDQLYYTFTKYLKIENTELKKINQDNLSLLDRGIIQSLINFAKEGDYKTIEYPLNHIIGKAKETIDLGNAGETIKIKVSYMKENKE